MITTTATQEAAVAAIPTKSEARPKSSLLQVFEERSRYEADVLVQLKSNIAQLEDLHARLKFMMSEVSYLLKKS